MFHTEVKFLTNDESIPLKNGDFKSYKYEVKKRTDESVFECGKRSYCERRGGFWRAPGPKQIRQLESKLKDRTIVYCDWLSEKLIVIVFSSGAIAYLTIKPETLDLTQVLFDKYCVGKLSGQTVTAVVFCSTHLLLMHADRTGILISFGKSCNSQPCRISDREPHLQSIELGGGARRTERKVSSTENSAGVRVLIWGTAAAEPAPWSPALEDVANLHLYQFTGQHISLVAYHQLENDTLSAELAHTCDNIIHIVEQNANHKTGVSLEWLRYELSNSEERTVKLSSLRPGVTQVGLPAPVRLVERSPCDAKLLAACIDGSIHFIHHSAGLVNSARAGFIASGVVWGGGVVAAAGDGRVHCFDRALAPLSHARGIDFAAHLRDSRRLQILAIKTLKAGPLILVSFSGVPLALLRITHPELLTAWLRSGRTANAVALLRAIDWETEGTQGLWALNRILCDCLRSPLHASGEKWAEAALGAYLAVGSHGPAAERLAPAVHDLARKFHHHLLRRGRIEKALSLSVELCAWDVCIDARWAAARARLPALAAEAASLAAHYRAAGTDCSDSCSECSSNSYTDSGGETSLSSAAASRSKPPPLPRVPNANRQSQSPTIVHVPISQAEPISTHSIRPNLHQYLERDNTIWNTAVKDDSHLNNYEIKPIINKQNVKWHSVDNIIFNYKQNTHKLIPVNEGSSKMAHSPAHFRHLVQTEPTNTLYRYQSSGYVPAPSMAAMSQMKQFRDEVSEKSRAGERNKVKFSDTVTVTVMPDSAPRCPSPARELAESLPLSPPHKYLADFAPAAPAAAPAPGTPVDYVEV